MIRVEYELGNDLVVENLTSEQVVQAFINEFSSKDKSDEAIVLDIFKAIDKTADDFSIPIISKAVKDLKNKNDYSITELVERLIAPAKELARAYPYVVVKYCKVNL